MAEIETSVLRIGSNDLVLQDGAARGSLANAYSASSTYAVGDYVLHGGQLYECNTVISTAEAWTAAHWTAVTVGGELSTVKDGLQAVETQITATLITDTASGAIASFPDGADNVPVKSLVVNIEPVQSGSGDPSPDNVRPITGHTSATVTRTGANVWDEVWETGGINQDGTNAPANDIIRSKNYIPVAPNTAYYCTYGNADKIYECFFYGPDKSHISNAVLPSTGVVTTPSNCGYMRFRCRSSYGATYKNDLSINYPATVTAYNAYNSQTVTIDLDGTRYGGSLDVGTGVLTVDRALVSITSVQGKSNTSANKEYYFTGVQNAIDATKSIISDKYPYNASPNVIYNTDIKAVGVADNGIILLGLGADGPSDMASANTFLPNNPITVCYFLKTPQTVQLTANEISTVLGQNNVWNDCGDTTVEYRADTKLYINKMLNA